MLIWVLQFEVGGIMWGLKIRGLRCADCGLKFGKARLFEICFSSMSLSKPSS